jgi:hypothetical protein
LKKEVKSLTSNLWICPSTSSKPERSHSSGARELQRRKPSLPCKARLRACPVNIFGAFEKQRIELSKCT